MTTLSGILPPVNVSTATGTLPHNKGGTGLTSAGAAGNVLTSDGDGWVSSPASGGDGSSVVISETAPTSPTDGMVWWNSDTGASYIYYDDGTTSQWVSFAKGAAGPKGETGETGLTGPAGPTGPTGPAAAVQYQQNIQSGNYTLVLDDAGKQIYSNNTTTQVITIPTNASVAFPIGSVVTVINRGTAGILFNVSGVSVFVNGSPSALTAPFAPPNSFVQLIKTETNSWLAATGSLVNAEPPAYLVVAGGGASGWYLGGGGGGGGYLTSEVASFSGTLTISVGAGGVAANSTAVAGSNSTITGSLSVTAIGGGGGGIASGGTGPTAGGSGGGSAGFGGAAGAGTAGQGYAGGVGVNNSNYAGGGGGGAGQIGGNGFAVASTAGKGGDGLSSSITGTPTYRAGGGGGGSDLNGGAGGLGGGAAGAGGYGQGNAGTPNTGGGAGATAANAYGSVGRNGGSGVVILSSRVPATATTGSPIITTVGSNTVYVFNASGTITFA